MADLDWGRSYAEHQRMRVGQLRTARERGERFFRLGDAGAVVDPSRLSDRQIEDVAWRDAERVVNRAIISHNEQAERRRPAA
ncbi:hypothetical protein [Nannocystis punicea]|uniref:Uncharacterized protein n=1 Tax=Nannocystis punicea TaxID=2995304 RepID=A0ABY7HE11_9BACT|nr:hypothetical protein [Nannocystis poenicansa]WAS97209.1 hypothetical protein O0S08_13760 [Nannocystis poenicansa]